MPSPVTLSLGIDGGGSKTAATLLVSRTDQPNSSPLDRFDLTGPSTNLHRIGWETVVQRLCRLVEQLKGQVTGTEFTEAELSSAVIGLAGIGSVQAELRLKSEIEKHDLFQSTQARLLVVNDAKLMLKGTLDDRPGIVLICGTGSIALGQAEEGKQVRAGGWGALVGDQGSGFWIGSDVIQRIIAVADEYKAPTEFTDKILTSLEIGDYNQFRAWMPSGEDQVTQIAALARHVADLAREGNVEAEAIIERAAEHLVNLVRNVHRRIRLRKSSFELVLVGGNLSNGSILAEQVCTRCQAELSPSKIHQFGSPSLIAAEWARRRC